MKYLLQFLKEHKGKTVWTLLLLLAQVVGTLYIPALIAGVVDDGILQGDMQVVNTLGIQMLIVAVFAAVVAIFGSYASADLAALFGCEMRKKLFAKTQEIAVQQFESIGVSSLITRATSDLTNLQQTFGLVFQLVVPAPIMLISAIIMTAQINVVIAFVLLLFIIFFSLITFFLLKKSERLSHSIQVRLDSINRIVRESITGIKVIRAFGNEEYEAKRSTGAFERYATNMIKLNKLFATLNPVVWILMGIVIAVIVAAGGIFSLQELMNVGEITAVCEYAIITLGYLIMAATTLATLPKSRACLERLEEVLDMHGTIMDTDSNAESTHFDEPALVFEHVHFAYPGAEAAVLEDISFQCRLGETTAIIGSTGSGKSTIADLILRFHDVKEGSIRMDGCDIRRKSQLQLRNSIGYVPQKAFLFSGTIADNLRMGMPDASEAQMWDALRSAQAYDFVSALPKQLESPVSQTGSNFSGGQRQRLSITRALIRNAPIVIFDDSFSALDTKTDIALRKSLAKELHSSVKLIITQRVSSIVDANQILVLDEGRLVGCGTHSQLLQSCTIYQDIVDSQMNRKEMEHHE